MLKIKLLVSAKRYAAICDELEKSGHQIDDNADLILSEKKAYPDFLMAKLDGQMRRLDLAQVTHIESLGHDIFAHYQGQSYKLNDRLFHLAELLNPEDFLRISHSVIVNVHHIVFIKPALSAKFLLTLDDGNKVDVTRSYYYLFKEYFNI